MTATRATTQDPRTPVPSPLLPCTASSRFLSFPRNVGRALAKDPFRKLNRGCIDGSGRSLVDLLKVFFSNGICKTPQRAGRMGPAGGLGRLNQRVCIAVCRLWWEVRASQTVAVGQHRG